MLLDTINNWFAHWQKYLFTFKDGFYELSYVGNSPQAMIASFIKMPFVKHDVEKQILYPNTKFTKGMIKYLELEEGLYITYSEVAFTANVRFKTFYDKFIPCDYYLLSYNVDINDGQQYNISIDGVEFANKSWSFLKPRKHRVVSHYKGSKGKYLSIFFNEKWLNDNLGNDSIFIESKIKKFLENETEFLYWPDAIGAYEKKFQKIASAFLDTPLNGGSNFLRLKIHAIEFIIDFLHKYKEEAIGESYIQLPQHDQIRLTKIENYLCSNLLEKFMGIDHLAEKFFISPTKLKSDFKLVYGKSIFQYFQEKQMQVARQFVEDGNLIIKEIAYKFGYENAGKFSAAYKKHFGKLPSEQLRATVL